MTLDQAGEQVAHWARGKRLISRVDFFGSRVRGNHAPDSDLDVAIVIRYSDADTCLAYWFANHTAWQTELQRLVPWRVDLQFHHPAVSGVVQSGVREASRGVYGGEA